MSDTKWRLSGGLGEPEEAAQVMTQGLGFPLRPVDGVPPQGSGDVIEGLDIAEGRFMQWMGAYQPGLLYPTGSVVLDGEWTMISNVPTVTKPAPIPVGDPTWSLPTTPAFVEQSNLSVVYSGHAYTFTKSGWVSALRLWVSELSPTTNYRVIVTDITDPNRPFNIVQEEPVLVAGEWTVVRLGQAIVTEDTVWLVKLDSLNSGASSVVAGGWRNDGVSNNSAPGAQGWNRRNQNDLIRIDKLDLDGTDRSSELLGMGPNTTVQFAQTDDPNYSITFRVDSGPVNVDPYFEYTTTLLSVGPSGAPAAGSTTTMTADVPISQLTKYVEVAGSVPSPSWAIVTGFLEFDGVNEAGSNANSYGVDLEFDEAVVNTAWDFVSYSGV
jgi:hypothetical protein